MPRPGNKAEVGILRYSSIYNIKRANYIGIYIA